VRHPEKQKLGPGRLDLENTSPQDQSTAKLSRLDFEDIFSSSLKHRRAISDNAAERGYMVTNRLINKNN
jgi:hypothetical protein